MEHIKAIMEHQTPYRGSVTTADRVREEIRQRFGEEAANEYDPKFNARTFNEWRKIGY